MKLIIVPAYVYRLKAEEREIKTKVAYLQVIGKLGFHNMRCQAEFGDENIFSLQPKGLKKNDCRGWA